MINKKEIIKKINKKKSLKRNITILELGRIYEA